MKRIDMSFELVEIFTKYFSIFQALNSSKFSRERIVILGGKKMNIPEKRRNFSIEWMDARVWMNELYVQLINKPSRKLPRIVNPPPSIEMNRTNAKKIEQHAKDRGTTRSDECPSAACLANKNGSLENQRCRRVLDM